MCETCIVEHAENLGVVLLGRYEMRAKARHGSESAKYQIRALPSDTKRDPQTWGVTASSPTQPWGDKWVATESLASDIACAGFEIRPQFWRESHKQKQRDMLGAFGLEAPNELYGQSVGDLPTLASEINP